MAFQSRTEEIFYDFLTQNHVEEALEILKQPNPDKHYSLEIVFARLPVEIIDKLSKSPLTTLEELDRALVLFMVHVHEWNRRNVDNLVLKRYVHARIFALPQHSGLILTAIPPASTSTNFCAIHGVVIKTNERKLIEHSRYYQCTKCKQSMIVSAMPSRAYEFPKEVQCEHGCTEGNVIPFKQQEITDTLKYTTQKDYQQIRIQECIDVRTDCIAKTMTVDLDNDLVDKVLPGYQLYITGTVMLRILQHKKNKKIQAEMFMVANHIEVLNDTQAVSVVTPESTEFFKRFWLQHNRNPLFGKNILLHSFAPHVFGSRWIKESLMVVLAGIPTASGKETTRANPHELLVGDSAVGKTKLLKYCASLIPGSVTGSGSGYSEAGLSCACVNTGNGWQLEPGLLPLASYSLAIVDEINLMKDSDKQILHEAMEQGSISFSKAGINATLKTKCSLLTACNPKFDRYDHTKELSLNIGLTGPLTSRFDIILMLQDERNQHWDMALADHILSVKKPTTAQVAVYEQNMWSSDMLKQYFAYIKNLQPTLTRQAIDILGSYYKVQRSKEDRDPTRTTPRLLNSLQRLAICHARLMFRDIVTTMDCVIALKLVDQSFGKLALFGTDNIIQSFLPLDPLADYIDNAQKILITLGFVAQFEVEKWTVEQFATTVPMTVNNFSASSDSSSILSTSTSSTSSPSSFSNQPRSHHSIQSMIPHISESDDDESM